MSRDKVGHLRTHERFDFAASREQERPLQTRQRRHMRPRLFVASSIESLDVAYAIQENLDYQMEVTVWTQGIFDLSKSALDSLYGMARQVDAAAFVFSPHDEAFVRGKMKLAVRDNVVFELGLFVGVLSPERCFILKPRSFSDLNFPSDLLGITPADYADDRQDGNMVAALGVACSRIRRALKSKSPPPADRHRTIDATAPLIQVVAGKLFRMYFNPPRYKHIRFEVDGAISEGKNNNEASWRIVGNQLELIQTDGRVHSAFTYDYVQERFEAMGKSGKGIAGQYIVPAEQ